MVYGHLPIHNEPDDTKYKYKMELRDGSGVKISAKQYANIKHQLNESKNSGFIKVKDIETDEVTFDGRAGQITGFKLIKAGKVYYYRCDKCDAQLRCAMENGKPERCKCDHMYDEENRVPITRDRLQQMIDEGILPAGNKYKKTTPKEYVSQALKW